MTSSTPTFSYPATPGLVGPEAKLTAIRSYHHLLQSGEHLDRVVAGSPSKGSRTTFNEWVPVRPTPAPTIYTVTRRPASSTG